MKLDRTGAGSPLALFLGLCVALSAMLGACGTIDDITFEFGWCSDEYSATVHMDRVERELEKWGTIATSGIIVLDNEGQFKIEQSIPLEQYLDAARHRVDGAAARFEEVVDRRASARRSRLMIPPTDGSALAAEAAQKALKEGEEATADGEEPKTEAREPLEVPDLPEEKAAEVLASPKFAGAGDLLGATPNDISLAEAIRKAYSDKTSERLMQFMLDPKTGVLKNEKIYLAVMQVHCSPGWRTRKDYIGDLRITVECGELSSKPNEIEKTFESELQPLYLPDETERIREEDTRLGKVGTLMATGTDSPGVETSPVTPQNVRPLRTGEQNLTPRPRVIAAFPLVESQNLDLRNSTRLQRSAIRQVEEMISESRGEAATNRLRESLRRLQFDAASRNAVPIVHAFVDNDTFGYQFYPVFQALEDPTDPESESEYVLHPISFPVLVVVAVDSQYLEQRGGNQTAEEGEEGKAEAATDVALRFGSHMRWYRRERQSLLSSIVETLVAPLNQVFATEPFDPERQSLYLRYEMARNLDCARGELEDWNGEDDVKWHAQRQFVRRELIDRYYGLASAVLGDFQVLRIQKAKTTSQSGSPKAPQITRVEPSVLWLDRETVISIEGESFTAGGRSVVESVTLGGVSCTFEVKGNVIVAVVPAWGEKEPAPGVRLVVTTSKGIAATGDIHTNIDPPTSAEEKPSAAKSDARTIPFRFEKFPTPVPRLKRPRILIERGLEGKVTSIRIEDADEISSAKILEVIRRLHAEELEHGDLDLKLDLGIQGGVHASGSAGK